MLLKRYLPARLKIARQRRKLTQRELAKIAGVSRSTLIRIEGGQSELNVSTMMAVCVALGKSSDYFLGIDKPVGLAAPAIHPGVFPIWRTADSQELQKCFACDSLLTLEAHTEAACMLANYERGRNPDWLVVFYCSTDRHVLRSLLEEQRNRESRAELFSGVERARPVAIEVLAPDS